MSLLDLPADTGAGTTATPTTDRRKRLSQPATLAVVTGLTFGSLFGTSSSSAAADQPSAYAPAAGWTGVGTGKALRRNHPNDLARAVQNLHDRSGLTWGELARLFGVSRRSLHFWVSNGRMSAAHVRKLHELESLVSQLAADDAEETRAALLAPRGGSSLFEEFAAETAAPVGGAGPNETQRSDQHVLSVADRLGAQSGRVHDLPASPDDESLEIAIDRD